MSFWGKTLYKKELLRPKRRWDTWRVLLVFFVTFVDDVVHWLRIWRAHRTERFRLVRGPATGIVGPGFLRIRFRLLWSRIPLLGTVL
jgi:hypothetical protein